jgi:hypothetical protein
LKLPAIQRLTQAQSTTVAQLTGPNPKLVTAVDGGKRSEVWWDDVAAEKLQGAVSCHPVVGQAKQLSD